MSDGRVIADTSWMQLTRAALHDVRRVCSVANWDGEGAKPITRRTLAIAELVVRALSRMLPKDTPAPDVIPEGDGEICITWSPDADRLFSVSLGEHGSANFAGQLGPEGGTYGWKPIVPSGRVALEDSLAEIAEHIDKVHRPAASPWPESLDP